MVLAYPAASQHPDFGLCFISESSWSHFRVVIKHDPPKLKQAARIMTQNGIYNLLEGMPLLDLHHKPLSLHSSAEYLSKSISSISQTENSHCRPRNLRSPQYPNRNGYRPECQSFRNPAGGISWRRTASRRQSRRFGLPRDGNLWFAEHDQSPARSPSPLTLDKLKDKSVEEVLAGLRGGQRFFIYWWMANLKMEEAFGGTKIWPI